MLETFSHAFSWVCGQNPDHTWMPGGLLLPCCQRCLGLYVGAGVAALLHAVLKPQPTARFLQIHGLFLLLMVPFGFHWLPHGELLRAWTGVLFGFGIVTFLWLTPSARSSEAKNSTPRFACKYHKLRSRRRKEAEAQLTRNGTPPYVGAYSLSAIQSACEVFGSSAARLYWLGLALTLLAVPALGVWGGRGSAYVLSGLAALGALVLAALVLTNIGLVIASLARGSWRRKARIRA